MCKLYSVIVYLMSWFLAVELLSFRFEAVMDMSVLLSTIHYACWSTAKNRKIQTRAWRHSTNLKNKRQQQFPCRELRWKTNLYTWRWPNSPKHALYKNKQTNPVAWFRERTIPTERPLSEKLLPTSADREVSRGQHNGSLLT
jgi:hypothetical protein